ncbi:MAG: hypothetical protein M3Z21_05915, partial [Pseudomonadota bacterium]|nr:hypothetical protein [Pseudomonadota bacterium]
MLPSTTERLAAFVDDWRRPARRRRGLALAGIGVATVAVALLVCRHGGPQSVLAHLMYAPVLLAAFCFQVPGGMLAGLAAGLMLGPLLPVEAAAAHPQTTLDWLLRTGFYVMAGGLAGLGVRLLNAQLDWLRHHAYHDALTGLPNLAAMRAHIHQLCEGGRTDILLVAFNLVNLA